MWCNWLEDRGDEVQRTGGRMGEEEERECEHGEHMEEEQHVESYIKTTSTVVVTNEIVKQNTFFELLDGRSEILNKLKLVTTLFSTMSTT